ncbi:hypothetical protein DL93DRAFT_628364 [Clavulina sp. PMI_390]|nr:hypothetical protein DL93DRAFT_628364 [Clavulina sp. PMI_390]
MFSNNKNRKLKAPTEAKDLFSAFASSSKVSVKTVVKPRPAPPAPTPIITTTHAPRTSSPLSVPSKSIPRPPSSASSSRPSTPTPQSPAKRKRAPPEDRDELDTVKKPRRSVPRDSVDRASSSSPAPSRGPRSSTPRSVVVPFGSVDKAIPRPLVVSQQDGNVVHVSSEDVITRMMADVSSGKKNKTSYVACKFLLHCLAIA